MSCETQCASLKSEGGVRWQPLLRMSTHNVPSTTRARLSDCWRAGSSRPDVKAQVHATLAVYYSAKHSDSA